MIRDRGALAVDIVTGAVVVSVAVALAGLTWRLAGYSGVTPPVVPPPPSLHAAATDVAPLLAAAPFGRSRPGDAPATSLPLILNGIMLAEPRAASTALITPAGAKPTAFGIGEPVTGGATIAAIEVDRVLLSVNGRTESLGFPGRAAAAQAVAPAEPAAAAPAAVADGPVALPPPRVTPPAPPSPIAMLGATRTDAGLSIGAAPPDAARRAGLQPGDVIERVNGIPLGDPARDDATLAAAARADSARVDLRRKGRRISLTLSLR